MREWQRRLAPITSGLRWLDDFHHRKTLNVQAAFQRQPAQRQVQR
jgi:hypothetical protein